MSAPMMSSPRSSKSFVAHQVLRDVDLSVGRSMSSAWSVPHRSVKSTLLRCVELSRAYDSGDLPHRRAGWSGTGRERNSAAEAPPALREHAREIGMVFPQFHLWPQ